MRSLNLFFQISTVFSLLVAGMLTFAVAQNADDQAREQKITVDIEVYENGETKKITKELEASEGEDIHTILKNLDILDDIDIRGTGEKIEIKVKKEVNGDAERDVRVEVFGDDEDEFTWFGDVAKENRALLGVFIESYNKDGQQGALVNGLVKESAAEKAGFKENDVIIGVNDTEITTEVQLREEIGKFKAGDEVEVRFVRDGQELTKRVELGEANVSTMNRFFFDIDDYGLDEQLERLQDMNFDFDFEIESDEETPFLGVTPGEKSEEGVSLGRIIEGSAAEKMGLQSGDVVTELDGKTVRSFDDLAAVIKAKKPSEELSVSYLRDGASNTASGELGKRQVGMYQHKVMKAPHCVMGGPGPWAPDVVKEVSVVIELKDCTKEEEELLTESASVNFNKSLALNKIEFAPNPNNGQFNLSFELPETTDTRIMVFDQMGRRVYEEVLRNFDGSYNNQIDISSQPSGVYFLIIAQRDKQFTKKIVKQ